VSLMLNNLTTKSVVFWVITRRRMVIIYRRFGTTYRSHLHGSSHRTFPHPAMLPSFFAGFLSHSESWPVKMGPISCPETSVNNYHTTPCNYPEDHKFHQHRGGSLKSNLTTNVNIIGGQWPYHYVHQLSDSRDTLLTLRHPTMQHGIQCL
jgi:hypothetical protein